MTAYQKIESLFKKISDLHHIQAMLGWDEACMMPTGGSEDRADALATLEGIIHQTLTDPALAQWIDEAKSQTDLDNWQRANLHWVEKKYLNATCLPMDLVEALAAQSVRSEQAWRQMRAENNWQAFAPILKETFNLVKTAATIRADVMGLSLYDVQLDAFSPGLCQADIDPIFDTLKNVLPTLIDPILARQATLKTLKPKGPFPIEKQKALGQRLMKAIGFDFHHGRLDTSHHPFCGGVPSDVRLTTRYRSDEFISALMGICHETGHARYEQNLPLRWRSQPVGQALGMTVHESQSLLIEMQACRSLEFMHYLSVECNDVFGKDPAFTPENLYQLYTHVARNLIRIDADEVTYPLHVILRYEIERDLFSDRITIDDLPLIWDQKMQTYLGLSTKDTPQDGVMQDVHWPSGAFGYFPAYTLGRLMAAQLFERATESNASILPALREGNFVPLDDWLQTHVHARASSVDTQTLLTEATSSPLSTQPFLRHLSKRYQVSIP